MCALALSQSVTKQLPRLEDARDLFSAHLPCPPDQLRRVYLRLALLYHPDKCSPEEGSGRVGLGRQRQLA